MQNPGASLGREANPWTYHGPSSKVGTTTATTASNAEVKRADDAGAGGGETGDVGGAGDEITGGSVAQLLPN